MPSVDRDLAPVVVRATVAEVPVVQRLMQLYLYDLATLLHTFVPEPAWPWDVNDDGTYGDPARVASFWTDPARGAFLVRVDGRLAGFALVRRGSQFVGGEAWEMSEFFVLGRFRRKGVGRRAAWRLFDEHPGPWEVAEMDYNRPAQAFWRRTIGAYTGERYQESRARLHGMDFVVQRFAAPGAAPCP